jgi:predicted metal-binding transcription factor (methanogenesis marker protein 9)
MLPALKPTGWWKNLTPETIGRWLSSFGGRRFLLSLGAGVVSAILVWYGKITDAIYRDVVLATVAAYITGNTYQKVKQSTGDTAVQVAEITGEAPITVDGTSAPIKVELSTKQDKPLGY